MPSNNLQHKVVQETYSCFRKSHDISHFLQDWTSSMDALGVRVHYTWSEGCFETSEDYHWYFDTLDKSLTISFETGLFDGLYSCLDFIMDQYSCGSASWAILGEMAFSVLIWNLTLDTPAYANASALSVVQNGSLEQISGMLESSTQLSTGTSFSEWLSRAVAASIERTDFVLYDNSQPFSRLSMHMKELSHGHVLIYWSEYQLLSDLSLKELSTSLDSDAYLDVINSVLKERSGVPCLC